MSARRKGQRSTPHASMTSTTSLGRRAGCDLGRCDEVPTWQAGANHSGTSRPVYSQPTPAPRCRPRHRHPTRRRLQPGVEPKLPRQRTLPLSRCASPRDRAGDQRFVEPPNAPCQSSRRAAHPRRGPHSATALQRVNNDLLSRTRATLLGQLVIWALEDHSSEVAAAILATRAAAGGRRRPRGHRMAAPDVQHYVGLSPRTRLPVDDFGSGIQATTEARLPARR